MKNLFLGAVGSLAMIFSLSANAEKIIIHGDPVLLEERSGMYYVPPSYQPSTYQYVTVDNTRRVCYEEEQPNLVGLDLLLINVDIGGTTTSWNCYYYDPDHFVITD